MKSNYVLTLRALVLASSCAFATCCVAQSYPAKTVRLIVPFAPGGTNDIIARVVSQRLGEIVGQQIISDNRRGAGGAIGMEAAAKAPPDGYTLVLGHIGTLAVNPTLYPKLPYDPMKDFEPITLVVTQLDMVMAGVPGIAPHTRAGKLRPLGVSSAKRLSVLPDIPTIAESGVPGFEATQWYGILAPARTSREIIGVLHAGLEKAMASPAVRERLVADAAEPVTTTPQEFSTFVKREIARWAPVVRKAGLVQ